MPIYNPGPRFSLINGFGAWQDPVSGQVRQHEAQTYRVEAGTPVPAAADGMVVAAAWNKEYGNHIVLEHYLGGKKIYTLYGNLDSVSLTVGTQVSLGSALGLVSNSVVSGAPQLQFKVMSGVSFNYANPALDPASVALFPPPAPAELSASALPAAHTAGAAGMSSEAGAMQVSVENASQQASSAFNGSLHRWADLIQSKVIDGKQVKDFSLMEKAISADLRFDPKQTLPDLIAFAQDMTGKQASPWPAHDFISHELTLLPYLGAHQFQTATHLVQYLAEDVIQVSGNEQADVIIGGSTVNRLHGMGGDDWLFGCLGSDTLFGDNGNDVLVGGTGDNDNLYGGGGSDIYVFGYGDGYDVIGDGESDLALGQDWVQLSAGIKPSDLIISHVVNGLNINIRGTQDNLLISGFNTGNGASGVQGLRFADGSALSRAELLAISIQSTHLNDKLQGWNGSEKIFGGLGNDVITGGGGNDTLEGGPGFDLLEGGGGANVLIGGPGNDVYRIYSGLDTVYLEKDWGLDVVEQYAQDLVLSMGAGITAADLRFTRLPNNYHPDFRISTTDGQSQISIDRVFQSYDTNEIQGIKHIQFADGTVMTRQQIQDRIQMGNDDINYRVGTDQADLLQGFGGGDVLSGGGGNDTLDGGAGKDFIFGGDGADQLRGGPGNDLIDGGNGADVYFFGRGDGQDDIPFPFFFGAKREDILQLDAGVSGSDIIFEFGNDDYKADLKIKIAGSTDSFMLTSLFWEGYSSIRGIRFADGEFWDVDNIRERYLTGTDGSNVLRGTNMNDIFHAGGGNDSLTGERGDDTMDGGFGNDYLVGDLGADVYLFGRGYGQDTISNYDYLSSTLNPDTLQLKDGITPNDVLLWRSADDFMLQIKDTNDNVRIRNFFSQNDSGTEALEYISFANGQKWDFADILARTVTIQNQTLAGGDGNDDIKGGVGHDSLTGGAGKDILTGLQGDDSIKGNSGDDTLEGGGGTDQLDGGDGNDVYRFKLGDGQDVIVNSDTSASAIDVLEFGPGISLGNLHMVRDNLNLVLSVNDSSDQVMVSKFFLQDAAEGNAYRMDAIRFADGSTMTAEQIKHHLLQASAQDDVLVGYSQDDVMQGLGGDDILVAWAGNDTLEGGAGNDLYYPGAGENVILFNLGDGQDAIANQSQAGLAYTGKNTLVLGAGIAPEDLRLSMENENLRIAIKGHSESIVVYEYINYEDKQSLNYGLLESIKFFNGQSWGLNDIFQVFKTGGSGGDLLFGRESDDLLSGFDGADTIIGFSGNDTLNGGSDNDELTGGDGNDVLIGGSGRDFLHGDDGNDTLIGGAGDDWFYGDGGVDTYRFGLGSGCDTVRWSLSNGLDVIELGDGITPQDVHLRFNSEIMTLSFAEDVLYWNWISVKQLPAMIRFADGTIWDQALLQQKFFQSAENEGTRLEGLEGPDLILGGGGADEIYGRTGNDTLDGGVDNDNLYGQEGDDSLFGQSGHDNLGGGEGNDTLEGGPGNDMLLGYLGNDVYKFKPGFGQDNIDHGIFDAQAPGDQDVVLFAGGIHPGQLNLIKSFNDLIVKIGIDQITISKYFWYSGNQEYNPEMLRFENGFTLDRAAVLTRLIDSSNKNGADIIYGTAASETLDAGGGENIINAGAGNDTLKSGFGDEALDGGDGQDSAVYSGKFNAYSFDVFNGVITISSDADGKDLLRNIETLQFTDRNVSVPDGLRYIASYGDLMNVFKTDGDAGLNHYLNRGANEGRKASFNPQVYLDKYADVRALAGTDLQTATLHFIQTGFAQGRTDSMSSADALNGTAGNDSILSYGGNDTLYGGLGNDVLEGGDGVDIARYDGKQSEYLYSVKAGVISVGDLNGANGNEGVDALRNIETLRFSDRDMSVTTLNALRYVASHADLIGAFGVNTDSATAHYLNSSVKENRGVTFDAQAYIDKYADVRAAVGGDLEAATRHFITTGFGQGRNDSKLSADNLSGTTGNDSVLSYGGNDTLWGGLGNDVLDGGDGTDIARYDGKQGEYLYSVKAGVISITDNNGANGNEGVDALRNIETLRFSDRDMSVTTLNVLRYVASHADLIGAFGVNTDSGMTHFLNSSVKENRAVVFDPQTYIDKYADVRAAVGSDLEAATRHFISTGFGQGRNDSKLSADNLSGTSGNDSVLSYGGNDTLWGGLGNDVLDGGDGTDIARYDGKQGEYLYSVKAGVISISDNNGANGNEGVDSLRNMETLRFADRDMNVTTLHALRYVASHADLIGAFGVNTDNGMAHYLNSSVKENRAVVFDPQTYIDKYADVRAAVGSDLEAATRHFISTGFGQGRNDSKLSADNLSGTNGNDSIMSYGGNDTLYGGLGNDVLNGGDGADIARYDGKQGEYLYSVKAGVISISDNNGANGNEGVDALRNMETLRFADRDMSVTTLNVLRYVASHADLIGAFGVNTDNGMAHYLNSSVKENRAVVFDPQTYIDKYADVRAAVGSDLEAATRHFISTGFGQGRSDNKFSADNLSGTSGNDSVLSYGGNDTLWGGLGNDVLDGGDGVDIARYDGKNSEYIFNVKAGVISITDNNGANGNEGVDTLRNIETLRFADRDMSVTSVQGLRYIASHADLIGAFGANADAGLTHYLNNAVREGRGVTFDPDIYLAKYADVRSAHGVDQEAATRHFISTGFGAGRNTSLAGNDVLGGSSGADVLDGGAGNDSLSGAGGADVFRFQAASGQDVVTDYNRAQGDKIWLKSNLNSSGILTAADVLSRVSGASDAVVDLGGGNKITLTGVAAANLQATDFVIF
ncbi:calcium-binding protein [Massilia sp. W12]|uniref:calcium-binding protein n=1 Tax=Massilia sp. W12 TaxID=3126507 RepID=UPI0030CF1EFD